MARAFIRIFFDWETKTAALTLEEQGRLLRALLAYARGEEPDLPGNEKFVFPVFQDQIDKDAEKYESILQRNQVNGAKGGRPPKNPSEPREARLTQQNPVGYLQPQLNPEKAKNEEKKNKYIYPSKSPTGGGRPNTFFDRFWDGYPRKVSKQAAFKAWNKLDPDEALTQQIIQAVERFRRCPSWQQDNGRFVPYPATFLNGRRWEDEPTADSPAPPRTNVEIDRGYPEDLNHLYD